MQFASFPLFEEAVTVTTGAASVKLTFFCHCGLDPQSPSVKCINQGIAARRPQ
jgi:hypothetical protein